MFKRLLILERKSFFRSANLNKRIAIKILLGLFALYFLALFLFMGIVLYDLLNKIFPEVKPIYTLNNFVLYWFIFEMFLRFMLQSLPTVNVKPLLVQNIKRKTIVNYLLTKSVISFFNLLGLLIFIPFAVSCVLKSDFSTFQILGWLTGVLSIIISINFLNVFIQKQFSENIKALFPLLIIVLGLFTLDYLGVFSVSKLFGELFNYILNYPVLGFSFILLIVLSYLNSYRYLSKSFYLDGALGSKSDNHQELNVSWTNRFGDLAPFLQLDLRLILRNKRAKSTLTLSFIMLFYGLLFYNNPRYENSMMLIFVGIFITGIFTINFGQFIPAWDSGYYSMLMSQRISFKLYLNAKATLMYISIVVLALLSTPYVYFGWKILLINLACALYNIGINVPLLLYFGSFNKKRIDLDKSPMFNYQGTGVAQWLVTIPLIGMPLLIWWLLSKFIDSNLATIGLGLCGLVGYFLKNIIINEIAKAYQKRKYLMIDGFKE